MTGAPWPLGHDPSPGSGPKPASLGLLATIAITATWGGILVIARFEQLLAPELRWWGHAFVHLWVGFWAGTVAVTAIRARRSARGADRALRAAVTVAALLGAGAAITNLLELVGAHPTLREFHDAVNRVGAPLGWLLLGNLIVILLLDRVRRAAARWNRRAARSPAVPNPRGPSRTGSERGRRARIQPLTPLSVTSSRSSGAEVFPPAARGHRALESIPTKGPWLAGAARWPN